MFDIVLAVLLILAIVTGVNALVSGAMKALRISNDDIWFWSVLIIGGFIILAL